LNFGARNIDYFIVGKLLGAGSLGFYKRAYDLAVLPKEKVADLVGRVFFSSLCRIGEDKALARLAYEKALKIICFISLPVLLGFILTAPELIKVIYGDKWVGAIRPLQIMSFGGVFYCLIVLKGLILLSYAKVKQYFYVQLLYAVMLLCGAYVGVDYGIEGVALGVTISLFLLWLINLIVTNKIIGMTIYAYYYLLRPVLVVNGILFICVFAADSFLVGRQDVDRLFSKSVLGVAIYLSYFMFTKDSILKELRLKVLQMLSISSLKFNKHKVGESKKEWTSKAE
ncbi:oligosaccharide flippase family protein, partial [Candidatus Roizmanbacteria bacterium]|nr:oligosaccharide flippase family protein [Candidatus Roizmanbacteria bacterium]